MEKVAVVTEHIHSINIVSYKNWFEKKTTCEFVSILYDDIANLNKQFFCRNFILIDNETIIEQHAKIIVDLKSKGVNIVWINRNGIKAGKINGIFCEKNCAIDSIDESLHMLINLADTIKDPSGSIYVVK